MLTSQAKKIKYLQGNNLIPCTFLLPDASFEMEIFKIRKHPSWRKNPLLFQQPYSNIPGRLLSSTIVSFTIFYSRNLKALFTTCVSTRPKTHTSISCIQNPKENRTEQAVKTRRSATILQTCFLRYLKVITNNIRSGGL